MKKILFILTLIIIPIVELFAQGSGGGPGVPPAVPIDGGLVALLAAGGLYGAKKLRDYRNRDN